MEEPRHHGGKKDEDAVVIEGLTKEVETLRKEVAALHKVPAGPDLRQDVAALQKDVEALAKDVAALRRELAPLEAQHAAVAQALGPVVEALRTNLQVRRLVRALLVKLQPDFRRGPLTDTFDAAFPSRLTPGPGAAPEAQAG